MTIEPRRYRPRRRRSGSPPQFQITPRDIDILRAVARYRFLNSRHIAALIEGSPKHIRIRLKLLYEHGLLDRPDNQYEFYRPGGGSALMVYALADKGARLIDETGECHSGRSGSWTQKNRAAGRPFLAHTLAIADFAVDLTAAVRRRCDIEIIDGDALISRLPAETRDLPKPLRITVPVILNGTRQLIGIEPDYAVCLGFPELHQRANYLVEIDRGTMPVERSDLGLSSILRKLIAYREVWRLGLHSQQFGWRNFRVLVLTTAAERAAGMSGAARRHLGSADAALFWFGARSELAQAGPLDYQWTDGTGRSKSVASP